MATVKSLRLEPDPPAKDAATLAPATGARRTLIRGAVLPSWVCILVLAGLFAFGLKVPEWVQYLPFVLSLILLGLPHGAVDHLVPWRLSGRTLRRSVVGVGALYLILMSLYLALWASFPAAAFVLFILLTWFHWGQGDLHALVALVAAGRRGPRFSRALTVFVRGGLPMLVPLLAFPEVYREIAASTTGVFGSGSPDALAPVFDPGFRLTAGAAFAAAALLSTYLGYRRSIPYWRVEAAEVVLLGAYFFLVPPVLAVGLYFCLWHAARHVARLMLLDKGSTEALERGRLGPAAGRFVRDAAPLTVAALALLAGLFFAIPGSAGGLSSLLGVYLVLISVLTLPHVGIVSFMDYRQGLWKRA